MVFALSHGEEVHTAFSCRSHKGKYTHIEDSCQEARVLSFVITGCKHCSDR